MELDRGVLVAYIRHACWQMLGVAERLGDERVNQRPFGTSTNAVAALIIHCDGVCEFWLGHVGLGRPSDRDRDAEFSATATVDELRERIDALLARVDVDLAALETTDHDQDAYADALPGKRGAGSLVMHVVEELYQHLGQMELTADALLTR